MPPASGVTLVVAAIRHVRIRMERERALHELEGHHGALKERHEALRQAFRELAHELRTPLTSAREFLEILLEGEAGPLGRQQREFVEISRRSCTQMNERLENLMEMARFETGKAHGHFVRAPLSDVVRPLLQALAPAATRAGVRLQWKGDRLPTFAFDAQRISQALENLVGNALKFAPAGSKIEIAGGVSLEDSDCIEIRVLDHGRGVDPEEAERLFSRGEQRHREDATARGGLGLGLAIAREIGRLHGGDLRVEQTRGGGATFILTLSRTLGAVPPAVLSS
jgi:signal transduction histidine kinase